MKLNDLKKVQKVRWTAPKPQVAQKFYAFGFDGLQFIEVEITPEEADALIATHKMDGRGASHITFRLN